MNKTARFIMALAIIAIVFSVIAFAVPFHHTLSFWIAYFAAISFGGHIRSRSCVMLSIIIGVNILNWLGAVIAQSGRQFCEN